MNIFQGRLCGLICPECPEPLSRVKVRLYRLRDGQNAAALAVANPKETLAVLSEAQIRAKEPFLLAELETDAEGGFVFEWDEQGSYRGEAFEVDVYCGTVPRQKVGPVPPPPRQLSVTTLQPQWRRREGGQLAVWDYCLPHRVWCYFRGLFGAWTICGQVVTCDQKLPVSGVQVIAFDADWTQNDQLGSGTTDAAGRFRIDYATADFETTPFSPKIDLELTAGPDLFFRVETPGGAPLLAEPASRGRQRDRENAGPCFCVDLCLPRQVPPVVEADPQPLFTHVGQYRVDATAGHFTTDGLTAAGNLAFTGTLPLRGLLPNGNAADAIEYRFQVAEYDATGTVLGAVSDVDPTRIDPTVIGQLEYYDWDAGLSAFVVRSADYWVNHPGAPVTTIHRNGLPDLTVQLNQTVQPDGWIAVPRLNDLTPNGSGLFVGGFVDLARLDTTRLTHESFDLTVAPVLRAGDPVPAGQRSRGYTFQILFSARQVGAAPPAILTSNRRDKIVLCNTRYKQHHHPSWNELIDTRAAVVLVDVAELALPGAGCSKIDEHVHALFTAYHPFLDTVTLSFEGPTPPPALPADLHPPVAAGEAVSPPGGHDFAFAAQKKCAYILWLTATLRLTSGFGPVSGPLRDHVAFCKG